MEEEILIKFICVFTILVSVANQLKRIQRQFLWGDILRKEEDAFVEMEFNHKTKKVRRTT